MVKIAFVVFVAFVSQVFSHHCGTMETCMKNVSNLETQASNFINNFLDEHEANLTSLHTVIHTKYEKFTKSVNGGLEVCKSFANSFHQKLSDSCGILPLTDDPAISDEKEYIERLPSDFQYTNNFTEKAEMCPHLVKYYNFVCDRIVYDVDTYLSCDINAKVNGVFEGPWKHCIHTFQQ